MNVSRKDDCRVKRERYRVLPVYKLHEVQSRQKAGNPALPHLQNRTLGRSSGMQNVRLDLAAASGCRADYCCGAGFPCKQERLFGRGSPGINPRRSNAAFACLEERCEGRMVCVKRYFLCVKTPGLGYRERYGQCGIEIDYDHGIFDENLKDIKVVSDVFKRFLVSGDLLEEKVFNLIDGT